MAWGESGAAAWNLEEVKVVPIWLACHYEILHYWNLLRRVISYLLRLSEPDKLSCTDRLQQRFKGMVVALCNALDCTAVSIFEDILVELTNTEYLSIQPI